MCHDCCLMPPNNTAPNNAPSYAPPNYIVHGAGAIGCVVAARLSQAGRAVSLIARGDHLAALIADGLHINGLTQGVFALPAAADARDLDIGPGNESGTVIILAMKTQDTFAAVEKHAELYRDCPIMCFQNSVSNEEWLSENGFNAYGVMVRIGARIDRPGVVTHTGARHAAVGCWPAGSDALCEQVVADLAAGDLDAVLDPQVRASKWGKLVINLSNAYLALTNQSVQAAYLNNDVRAFVADLEQEAADVLEAAKIAVNIDGATGLAKRIAKLRKPLAQAASQQAGSQQTGSQQTGKRPLESFPSTWQDLKAGRKSVEVDHFNGRIAELGKRFGIATPLNQVLWERCNDAAARQLGPGTETEASIRSAAASR